MRKLDKIASIEMHSYNELTQAFATEVAIVIGKHQHLSASEIIGGLRLVASALEAHASDAKITVQFVNIEKNEDTDRYDKSEDWKNG